MAMFTTNPVALKTLLDNVEAGRIQLPEFQRGWVWDDYRIRALLASISRGFPIGAVMTLQAGGEVNFKARMVEGAEEKGTSGITQYLLDGQQRLTSLYQALKHQGPVVTGDDRKKRIKRWYYIDMVKALDGNVDREEAIISVPENKQIKRDFARELVLDLSTPELEYEQHKIPTERLLDPMNWMLEYLKHWEDRASSHPTQAPLSFWATFNERVVQIFSDYALPVIALDEDTPKEAVCTVFEKVNTGGVTLTVFELVTASFAADDFALRDDWQARRDRMHGAYGVLRGIQGEQFLQAVTLLATQHRHRASIRQGQSASQSPRIACQKRDILNLTLSEYKEWADKVEAGFKDAAQFLHSQFIFKQWDVPYNTQLVPLAALCVELGSELDPANAKDRLLQWYWSGIFGEVYGSGVETQYALDLVEVAGYIRNDALPTLISEANFNPERLISLRTRNSAAYKGLYALQMKSGAADWRTGNTLTFDAYRDEAIDIHHVFPVAWCDRANPAVPAWLYNSIINKTPIDSTTNRIIGGAAPSRYLARLKEYIAPDRLRDVLESHWLNPDALADDDFATCFIERGEQMLGLIGSAMGKEISGGREAFRSALVRAGLLADVVDPPEEPAEAEEFDEEPEYDEIGSAAFDSDDAA